MSIYGGLSVRRLAQFTIVTVAGIGLTAASAAIPSAGLAATARLSSAARLSVTSRPLAQVPRAAQNDDQLSAVSSSGGWAVGSYNTQTGTDSLIEHWNGTAWGIKPSPSPGRSANDLLGVSAVSSNSAWAVGYYGNSLDSQRTLIEHWNGRAWKRVASPNAGGVTAQNRLLAVAAVSPSSVWAVGARVNATSVAALIEHWNGRAWKLVASPNLGRYGGGLQGVVSVSASSVWAVGSRRTGTSVAALIEHWNGRAWKVMRSPSLGSSGSELLGVAAASSSSAWAVGIRGVQTVDQTLIEHWNGRAWKVVRSPNPGGRSWENDLFSVAAASPRNVWAVGAYRNATTGLSELTLIEHWNGRAWKAVPSPDPGGTSMSSELSGVAAATSRSAWAVGSYSDGSANQTLLARWNGRAWTQVPSPDK
jgi:hypothetical protein